jgi:zinc finger protein
MHELQPKCKSGRGPSTNISDMWQGITRILPMTIPYFKQILLESFSCDHCGAKNTSVQNAGSIQEKGVKYTFRADNTTDLNRQIIKGDHGIIRIDSLGLDMPRSASSLTNVEGILAKISSDLEQDQPQRKEVDPRTYSHLEAIITQLNAMRSGADFPIYIHLDDPSGNSFISPDPIDAFSPIHNVGLKYTKTEYIRTHAQNVQLGLTTEDAAPDPLAGVDILSDEVQSIPVSCPACTQPCTMNAHKTHIPHFRDVIIMATSCDHCGYKTNDVNVGGEVPDKGKRITVSVKTIEDLNRDILKSGTCGLKSPDLGLEVHPGTLGGRFTTIEGLLTQVRDQLKGQIFDTTATQSDHAQVKGGDSISPGMLEQWNAFFAKLDEALQAKFPFAIILEDPMAASFVQRTADGDADTQVKEEEYERTAEEEEELGLKDMKVEGYAETDDAKAEDEKGET